MSVTVPSLAPMEVSIDYSTRVNFAFQQNAIPVFRRIEIRNNSANDLKDVVCKCRPTPNWARAFEQSISLIPADSDYVLSDVPIVLDLSYLASLSDRVRGEVEIEILGTEKGNSEPTSLFKKTLPVEVFAFDEWTGLSSLPEILGAFVTPNILVVEKLLSRSADFLGDRTNSSALNGYQEKSKKRVFEILDCLFDAVREQGIRYSNPPASFEKTGQRIRFGEQIIESKLATCLDLSLLFAALIEQSGLRPIVLMHEGHAYVGCWMIEECFPEPSCDDLQSIRKRVELEEVVLFESTLCCEGNNSDFTHSVSSARQHLKKDDIFQYAICVFRARSSGIRPLPIKREDEGVDLVQATRTTKILELNGLNRVEQRQFTNDISIEDFPKTAEGRIDHWKQQLLDLTLRNRLLNFRETKQTIPLVCPYPEKFEDELAANKSFKILEQTKLMAGLDPRSLALQERQFAEDPVMEHLVQELHAKRLRSPLTETELSRRLIGLYRRARSEMEESGANTLYLALGFLEWKETKHSDRTHRAPILLIPLNLNRKSVHQGFSIQRCDEDAIINVTLLELLRRDFELEVPGVNPPPEDESGVDVGKVFWLFQQAVKDMPGWEVHREVWVAQFSFSKFLLWKDLNDRVTTLTGNSVVDHLVNKPGEPFIDDVDNISERDLDKSVPYEEVFCPVSADSSQLAAIIAASNGKNFVMHGPPGTGKSQTITNLIAHCLALGKRVLFVAEKRAALEVVHKRLSQIGLGPFCLELHSNKTGKADVLKQFGESLDYANQHTPEEWQYIATQLEKSRAELNVFVSALHKVYPNGMTAYHCYSWLIAERDCEVDLQEVGELRMDGIEEHSRERYEELLKLCDDLQVRGSERRLSAEAKDALRPFAHVLWTPDWEEEALAAASELKGRVSSFESAFEDVRNSIGIGSSDLGRPLVEIGIQLARLLVDSSTLPAEFIQSSDWSVFREQATSFVKSGRKRDEVRKELDDFELPSVLNLDVSPFRRRFEQLNEASGFVSSIKKWFLLKPIRQIRKKNAGKWKSEAAPEFFKKALELQAAQNVLYQAKEEATKRLAGHWNYGEANWDELENILRYGDDLHRLVSNVAGTDVDQLVSLRSKIGQLLPMAADMLATGRPLAEKIAELDSAWERLCESECVFRELCSVDPNVPLPAPDFIGELRALTDRVIAFRPDLHNWCRWQDSYQIAVGGQLGPLLRSVEQEVLSLDDIRFAFEKTYRDCFLRRLISVSDTLRDFWGDEHQKRIEAFNDLDERYTKLTVEAIAARLAGELPRARNEECPRNTELGILQRERSKKARHQPVRKLFSQISTIVPRLKPCFLMSPLSVAQYLDVEQDNFDLVVFDEASQIPVWDAVGAIARGKQVVIVGDPKQLPPTNFFGRADSDEYAIDDGSIQDLESILDECLGSGLGTYNLRWHYRSRREGLIAFSNHHYYENLLYTFPSPHSENVGVRLVSVPDGYYDKGKSRTNRGEAEAIKAEVIRRLRDPILSRQTIGIVTFSQAQQTLVLDKLDEARREYPEIEGFFSDEMDEPVFVKNLENVQGDERDVIIFSICYGPDQAGKISMNFGPLNRSGGERRLNVAVTRAKLEIIVFSTLRSEQIDLSRTRAIGAEHLKAYLEYAERGPRTLATSVTTASQTQYDSIFEKQVAELLRAKGYEVHTQVGCSGYKIDLAVVAPDLPGHYVLGIECDGATYHQAATARDRDRLRQSVLEGLGWTIHRIWSTDWWRDHDRAVEDLVQKVEEEIEAFQSDEPLQVEESESLVATIGEDGHATGKILLADEEPARYASLVEAPQAKTSRAIDYPVVEPQIEWDQEAFYLPTSIMKIKSQMVRIVEEEGPIVESLLIRRVAEEWQFGRAASRIRNILKRCYPSMLAKSRKGDELVFWPEALSPSEFGSYRVPNEQRQSHRSIEEIPSKELQNAAMDILEMYISFPREDLQREIAKKFGISRLTKNIASHLNKVLDDLAEGSDILLEGDVVKFAG